MGGEAVNLSQSLINPTRLVGLNASAKGDLTFNDEEGADDDGAEQLKRVSYSFGLVEGFSERNLRKDIVTSDPWTTGQCTADGTVTEQTDTGKRGIHKEFIQMDRG